MNRLLFLPLLAGIALGGTSPVAGSSRPQPSVDTLLEWIECLAFRRAEIRHWWSGEGRSGREWTAASRLYGNTPSSGYL